jgi:hypothetical protein
MKNMFDIVFVPLIIVTVYWIMNLYKYIVKHKEKYVRLIPVLAAPLGAILGVTLFFAAPELMPAKNVVMAFMIGGASGLAATGTDQIFKQMSKTDFDE